MAGHVYAPDREASGEERAAIEAVCREYAEAWYTADETRMRHCLHPDLDKRGMVRRIVDDRAEFYSPNLISAATMVELTGAGVGETEPEERRINITILATSHHLAAARVDTRHMTDLLHLMRFPAGWKILHSIWTLDGGVIANNTTDT